MPLLSALRNRLTFFSLVKLSVTVILGVVFMSCSVGPKRFVAGDGPSTPLDAKTKLVFSKIIKKDEKNDKESAKNCPAMRDGDICLMNWDQAMEYCKSQNARLPTARDYANFLLKYEIKVITEEECKAKPKDFYPVFSVHDDLPDDNFCMNHKGYKRPDGETESHLLWTSSMPLQSRKHAHVFYDQWGGGGGKDDDHRKAARNSVQCVTTVVE